MNLKKGLIALSVLSLSVLSSSPASAGGHSHEGHSKGHMETDHMNTMNSQDRKPQTMNGHSYFTVYFDTASSSLRNDGTSALNDAVHMMSMYPHKVACLKGRADERGGMEYNQKLSHGRVESTMTFLKNCSGMYDYTFAELSLGKEYPIAKHRAKDTFLQKNRSVMIEFVDSVEECAVNK